MEDKWCVTCKYFYMGDKPYCEKNLYKNGKVIIIDKVERDRHCDDYKEQTLNMFCPM